jgi:hypothetical protein
MHLARCIELTLPVVTELGRTIGHLSQVEKETAPVKHALAVQNAMATGNYHRFFKLYDWAMSRTHALDIMVNANILSRVTK